jgi:protein TonB
MKQVLMGLFFLIPFASSSQVEKGDTTVYTIVEEPAEYPGGIAELVKFFHKNMVYPQTCVSEGLNGSVYLKFVVNKEGYAVDPEVMQRNGTCSELEKEGLRVLKLLPKWKPGKINGLAVNSYYQLPMKFCPIK